METGFFYIIFSLMVVSAVLSLTFYLAWKNFGRKPHALTWSLAFLAGTGQWLAVLGGDHFPSLETYLLTESAFSLTLITLALRGHCQRTNCKRLPSNLFPYVSAIYAFVAWHVLVTPHMGIRLSVAPTYSAITLLISAVMIVRYREKTRPAEWAAAIAIGVFALTQAGCAALAYLHGPDGDESIRAAYLHFSFLTLPAGYVTVSMLIILMMASDLAEVLKKAAIQDHLTGLLNRRGFSEYGERQFSAARRAGTALSIIMMDIDRFKFINDKYGHAAGDAALTHFAKLVAEAHRKEDIVARVGGEEFAVLLPGTDLRDAMAMADQLCTKIGATPLDMTGNGLPMTSSFGVAAISKDDDSLEDMVLRADRALYRSKRGGRNQVDLESSQLVRAADGTLVPARSK